MKKKQFALGSLLLGAASWLCLWGLQHIERRMKKYSRNPEALTPGEAGKKISQMIYNPQSGGIDADEYRMAGKL